MPEHAHSNHLIHETSPYLLQHAHNPVDWHPWNEQALGRARDEDRPILLSLGYSACHWCHVMEHESFEDPEIARIMNAHFVCIKVDREERPDLDKIYQTAHQVLTRRPGGWPLNMFLTPDDHLPFFGGTYFPKRPRFGMPAFGEVLRRVAEFYRDNRDAIREQGASLRDVFRRIEDGGPRVPVEVGPGVLDRAYAELQRQFDPRHGGFGGAPKFPHPGSIELCLRHYARGAAARRPDPQALDIARRTLCAMARGGLYDQLGGGFCRYAVDEQWQIPHFEKMLYDNAQLLALYADGAVLTGDAELRRAAEETGAWVMREMQSPAGGYYSTLDADSEGEEGRFYVWGADEVRALLEPQEWAVVEARFGLDGTPNFEGRWHLNVRTGVDDIARALGRPGTEVAQDLERARARLLAARGRRVRPGRDEKILTAWNGLMIKGMARAGRLLGRDDFMASAGRALDFVLRELWRDGRLLATAKDGRAHLNAYLDDYVFLIDGILELLQARWRAADLAAAVALAEAVLARFPDRERGGFYFTADDHERLVYRPKPGADDAIPSGNAVAALVLLRLGHLLGEARYLEAAAGTIAALYPQALAQPSAYGALMAAVEEYLFPTQTVVLRGRPEALAPALARAQARYSPRRLVLAIPSDADGLAGMLAERVPRGAFTAYVCTGHACAAPVTDPAALEAELAATEAPALA